MLILSRALLGTLLAASTIHASSADPALQGAVDMYYGASIARRINDSRFQCAPGYRCRDPIQSRLELERYGRAQELRERATQIDPRIYGPDYGPWGPQRYIPPATPEANIQPAYRGASRLRSEYEQSGQPIDGPIPKSLK